MHVRKDTMEELLKVYRAHCLRCAERAKQWGKAEAAASDKAKGKAGEEGASKLPGGAGVEEKGGASGVAAMSEEEELKEEKEEVEKFEWIPSKVLKCCYFKDCKDFK